VPNIAKLKTEGRWILEGLNHLKYLEIDQSLRKTKDGKPQHEGKIQASENEVI